MKHILFAFIILMLNACGYKPTVTYVHESLKGNVYVDVPIDIHNINNSIIIKEALIDIFANKFDMNIVNQKSQAELFITGKLLSVIETQLESENGYSKLYRESVNVQIKYSIKNKKLHTINVSNYYDFVIDENSVASQRKKDEAIKMAIKNALLDVPSKIAISTVK